LCLYLGAAARLGHMPALRRLAAATEGALWPQARMLHLFAQGRLAGDDGLLMQAAEVARREGNDLFAYELAQGLVQTAASQLQVRQARRLRNASFRNLRRDRAVRQRISELSDFERELAMAAGQGRSSSSLAKELHLSPRTVDWHLGRIYSRLHVSSRAELREVLA
jgi:DNA-binding CsgD family transcriptional regulator